MPVFEQIRQAAGGAAARAFFGGSSRLARLHPQARPEAHGIVVERDLPYGAGPRHRLDLYRPADARGPLPTVFYIHGGGFRILSKETHWVMGLAFARRGYLVVNVEYRLAPKAPFPSAVEDVAEAFRWLVEHGPRHGVDLSRLVFAGESAGANLATTLALSTVYERPEPYAARVFATGVVPRAVIPACGILQVSDAERFRRRKPGFPSLVLDRIKEVGDGYLTEPLSSYGASLDLADPLVWAERGERPARPLPPFLLQVGTRDPLLDDTRRMQRALTELGGLAEAQYYPGGIHAFHAFVFLESARRCWREKYSFLERHVS